MLLDEQAMQCTGGSTSPTLLCAARDLELNLVFSIANVALLLSSLPLGFTLQYFGPKRVAVVGNIMIAIGAFVIAALFDPADTVAVSKESGELSRSGIVLMVGMALISFFGPAIQVTTLAVGVLFPRSQATVVGVLSGCMGGSAIVLPAYAAVHAGAGATISGLFWWHGAWSLAMGVAMAVILPLGQFDDLVEAEASRSSVTGPAARDSAHAGGSSSLRSSSSGAALTSAQPATATDITIELCKAKLDGASEAESSPSGLSNCSPAILSDNISAVLSKETDVESVPAEAVASPGDGKTAALSVIRKEAISAAPIGSISESESAQQAAGPSTWTLLRRPWFVALIAWMSVQYLRLVFYLGSTDLQLRDIALQQGLTVQDAEQLLPVLGWIAPLGALAAPAAGIVQDRYGITWALLACQGLGIVHAALSMVPVLGVQPVAFLAYTWQQEAAFAVVLAGILDGFGAAKSGIGAGVVFVAGAICSAVISPITAAVLDAQNGFGLVNGILLALTLASTSLPIAQLCGVKAAMQQRPVETG